MNVIEANILPLLNLRPTQRSILQHKLDYLSDNYYRIMDVVRQSGMGVQEYKDYLLNEGVDISKFDSFFDQFEWDGTGVPLYQNRNMLLDSDDFSNLSTVNTGTYTYQDLGNGYTNIKTSGATGVLKVYRNLNSRLAEFRGENFTYVAGIINNTDRSMLLQHNGFGSDKTIEPNKNTTVVHAGQVSLSANPQIQFRSVEAEDELDFDITPIMIVKGDNPVYEWEPAPEDTPTKGLYYNENNNTITPILPANYNNIINFRRASEQRLNDNGFFEIDVTEADVLDNDLEPSDLVKNGNKYILI